jgi:hypothetical protein
LAVVDLDRVGLGQRLAVVEEVEVAVRDAEVPADGVARLIDRIEREGTEVAAALRA